jgi:hypothetical protein
VPNRNRPGRFTAVAAEDSVIPYPSTTSMPAAWNHSATSRDSGALPDTNSRIRPPKRSRSLLSTSLSAPACATVSARPGLRPCCTAAEYFRPVSNAFANSFALTPPSASTEATTRLCTFSKIRGAPAMNVGRTRARFSTILSMRPSTADAKPISSWAASSTLPNECDSGSHRYCRSPGSRMPSAATAAPSYVQLSWTSRTPLGRPVVPEV